MWIPQKSLSSLWDEISIGDFAYAVMIQAVYIGKLMYIALIKISQWMKKLVMWVINKSEKTGRKYV